MKPLKTAVVGAGVGRLHIESYQSLPYVEAVALCDNDTARLSELADRYGVPLRYTDYEQLFQSGEVDAVSIALPNNLHAPVAIAALQAGLHVLCEKPLAENVAAGQRIVEVAARSPGKFMICYNRRYRPDVLWMKRHLSTGRLGRIYQVNAGWIRETGIPGRGWFINKQAAGGGPLIDLGVHMLDLVMWLLDYPQPLTISGSTQAGFGPRNLKAWLRHGQPISTYEVEDSALAFIRLDGGITVNLEASWASHGKPGLDDFYVTLLGTEGSIHFYVANYAKHDTLTLYTEIDGVPVTTRPHISFQESEHYLAVAQFVNCVQQDLPSPAPAAEGLVIMQMIEAIYRSAEQGREISLGDEK
jgi:predicted dehydrogenase